MVAAVAWAAAEALVLSLARQLLYAAGTVGKKSFFKKTIFYLSEFLSFFLCLFRAVPVAYGGSQAIWGQIGAVAASLHQSHSNVGSKLSGLRIQHCHELWCRLQRQLRSGVAVAGV